jgi:hypothetical protein
MSCCVDAVLVFGIRSFSSSHPGISEHRRLLEITGFHSSLFLLHLLERPCVVEYSCWISVWSLKPTKAWVVMVGTCENADCSKTSCRASIVQIRLPGHRAQKRARSSGLSVARLAWVRISPIRATFMPG